MTDPSARARWEARYGAAPVWSGQVNGPLRAWGEEHPPHKGDSALDLGCGEGGDALWLAHKGWRVTGVDFAAAAIVRAGETSSARGLDVNWVVADLATWTPPSRFELVSLSFFHEAMSVRHAVWRTAARAVSDKGTLLITGHATDPSPGAPGPGAHTRFDRVEIVEVLGRGWVHTYREVRREAVGKHAGHVLTDVVIELSRAQGPARSA